MMAAEGPSEKVLPARVTTEGAAVIPGTGGSVTLALPSVGPIARVCPLNTMVPRAPGIAILENWLKKFLPSIERVWPLRTICASKNPGGKGTSSFWSGRIICDGLI